ncbi:hypothetical protein RRG08_021746 [Elysia crispata]|uniref:Uncharacterized protein n=1 Tax=Elysia crispata TaxID=231223 RepID=A0AAE1DPL9_9GAST|nr:hypothetical protein RRG08_021746 [Elysia crispata]
MIRIIHCQKRKNFTSNCHRLHALVKLEQSELKMKAMMSRLLYQQEMNQLIAQTMLMVIPRRPLLQRKQKENHNPQGCILQVMMGQLQEKYLRVNHLQKERSEVPESKNVEESESNEDTEGNGKGENDNEPVLADPESNDTVKENQNEGEIALQSNDKFNDDNVDDDNDNKDTELENGGGNGKGNLNEEEKESSEEPAKTDTVNDQQMENPSERINSNDGNTANGTDNAAEIDNRNDDSGQTNQ